MTFKFLPTTLWAPSLRQIIDESWFVRLADQAIRDAILEDPYIGELIDETQEGSVFLAKIELAPNEDGLFSEFYATYLLVNAEPHEEAVVWLVQAFEEPF